MRPPMPVVVGVPRSGTTLLRLMLDAHPAMAVPPETGFLPALAALDPATDVSREAWRIITRFPTWPDFQLDADALRMSFEREAPLTPADAARSFYRAYAQRFGKSRWGDKTPTYGAELTRIESLLPEARFVHLIRDGRDVALSIRRLWFRPGDSVEAWAGDWVSRIAQARALGRTVQHYLEVRYEALVHSTEPTLRAVCRFLEVEFHRGMLDYHVHAAVRLDEHQDRYGDDGRMLISKRERLHNQRLVTTTPRAERIGRWRTEMTGDEIRRFEAVAGASLRELGYPIGFRTVW